MTKFYIALCIGRDVPKNEGFRGNNDSADSAKLTAAQNETCALKIDIFRSVMQKLYYFACLYHFASTGESRIPL